MSTVFSMFPVAWSLLYLKQGVQAVLPFNGGRLRLDLSKNAVKDKGMAMQENAVNQQLEEAFALFSSGECGQALNRLEQIISVNPKQFDALNGAGIVAYHLDDAGRAIDYLSRAQRVNPQDMSCYHNLAGILMRLNRLNEAGEIIERGLAVDSDNADLLQVHHVFKQHCLRLQTLSPPGPSQGYEAWITYLGDRVKKTYKPVYFDFNRVYDRRGEAYYLQKYPSPFFIPAISLERNAIVMKYGGRPIGSKYPASPRKYKLDPESLNLPLLVKWLHQLRAELQRLGLKHRDINPTNILYHPERDEYRLIDLTWMIAGSDPDGPATHPDTLNEYARDDEEAIRCLSVEAIQALIGRINRRTSYDGSSVRPGWVYHPLAFDEFKAPAHKTAAIDECREVIVFAGIKPDTACRILEVGSSVGYFSFKLADLGCAVTAFEADPDACRVAEAMRVYKQIDNIVFHNRCFDFDALDGLNQYFDVTLMLNVHMWLHKLMGPCRTMQLMRRVSKITRKLFFQTAHAQSSGMYLVKELTTSDDIKCYLEDCGFSDVRHLRDTTRHGGIRALFSAAGGAS